MSGDQVLVHFVSKDPKYELPDMSMLVPLELKRVALSELVCHLLGLTDEVLFDFLYQNQMIRSSLRSFLDKGGLSKEETVTIEIKESMRKPESKKEWEDVSWVSALSVSRKTGLILTGSYDDRIKIYQEGFPEPTIQYSHKDTIKDVIWVSNGLNAKKNEDYFVSASQDSTVGLWKMTDVKRRKFGKIASFEGHEMCVKAVAESPNSNFVASCSWDKTIKLWSLHEYDEKDVDVAATKIKKSKKKVKIDPEAVLEIIPVEKAVHTIKGHTGPCSDILWTADGIISSSWDHSVKIWDPEQAESIHTLRGEYAAHSICAHDNLIAVGYSDFHLKIFDKRADGSAVMKLTMTQPSPWIYCLSWSPDSDYNLVSGSADANVRIWDIRSANPIHMIKPQGDSSILAVDWINTNKIYVGGDSGNISRISI